MPDPVASAGEPGASTPLLVLGSASPARATLLRNAGVPALVLTSGVDEESLIAGFDSRAGDAEWLTQRLARAKALDVADRVRAGALGERAQRRRVLVVGADSMLDLNGHVLGKARTPDEVRTRWAAMAGGTGMLVTGHTVVDVGSGQIQEATCSTLIRFGRPDAEELEDYIASGEPLAVAGSCTIDGLGGPFIEGIDGDHSNVIGLALPTLRRLLAAFGVRWTALWELS